MTALGGYLLYGHPSLYVCVQILVPGDQAHQGRRLLPDYLTLTIFLNQWIFLACAFFRRFKLPAEVNILADIGALMSDIFIKNDAK